MNKNKKFLILIIFVISIGFAYLSATLGITGLVGYKASKWDVHFDNIVVSNDSVEGSKPIIDDSKAQVTFSTELSSPGEVYEFSIDVVNAGNINAMIDNITMSELSEEDKTYYNYTVSYYDGTKVSKNDLLKKNSKAKLKVKVEYKYDIEDVGPAIKKDFSLQLTYVRATQEANDIGQSLINTGTNNFFILNNVLNKSLTGMKIYGNTMQDNYSGSNLINYKNNINPLSYNTSDDGFITLYNNEAKDSVYYPRYYIRNTDLEPSTTYLLVIEIKDVSGVGIFVPIHRDEERNEGIFTENIHYNLSELKPNSIITKEITTIDDFSDIEIAFRIHSTFSSGQTGSITFRLSVLKDTTVTADTFKYEPYVGGKISPNVDYPQEVKNVSNNVYLKVTGKNMFNLATILKDVNVKVPWKKTCSGVEFTINEDGSITAKGTATSRPQCTVLGAYTNTKPIFTIDNVDNTYGWGSNGDWTKGITVVIGSFNGVTHEYLNLNSNLINKKKYEITHLMLDVAPGTTVDETIHLQLEKGTKATSFEPYKEKRFNLNLKDIKLNSLGEYKDYIYYDNGNWYIHRAVGFKKIESLFQDATNETGAYRWAFKIENSIPCDTNQNNNVAYSNIANLIKQGNTYHQKEGFTISDDGHFIIYNEEWKNKSKSEIDDWLANNEAYIYYPYKNPYEELIKDNELINQLNNIIQQNLFEGTNLVSINSDVLTPYLEFDYLN